MTDDYYGMARQVAGHAREEGHEDFATALEDAIAAGFTSGEILMALRWHLNRFLDAAADRSEALERAARDLRDRIETALTQPG